MNYSEEQSKSIDEALEALENSLEDGDEIIYASIRTDDHESPTLESVKASDCCDEVLYASVNKSVAEISDNSDALRATIELNYLLSKLSKYERHEGEEDADDNSVLKR